MKKWAVLAGLVLVAGLAVLGAGELKGSALWVLESSGATYFHKIVGSDLSADVTHTLPAENGTIPSAAPSDGTSSGKFLTADGDGTYSWTDGLTSIGTGDITREMLEAGAATSVIGRSAGTTGAVDDISTTTDGHVLRRTSGTLGFSALGTMADQNAASVGITGGTINGVTIGSGTPGSGVFTTLNASGNISSTAGRIWVGTDDSNYAFNVQRSGSAAPIRGRIYNTGTNTADIALWQVRSDGGDARQVFVYSTAVWTTGLQQSTNAYIIGTGSDFATPAITIASGTRNVTLAADQVVQGGDLQLGVAGTTRGILELLRGTGSTANSGAIKFVSADGTPYWIWPTTSGQLRIKGTSAPSSDSDGSAVAGSAITPAYGSMQQASKIAAVTDEDIWTTVTGFTAGVTDGSVVTIASSIITVGATGNYEVTLSSRVSGGQVGISVNDGDPTAATGHLSSDGMSSVIMALSATNTLRVKVMNPTSDADVTLSQTYITVKRLG